MDLHLSISHICHGQFMQNALNTVGPVDQAKRSVLHLSVSHLQLLPSWAGAIHAIGFAGHIHEKSQMRTMSETSR